jgi:3-oxoacyl-[acyl-carrier-protein] synthase-3
LVLFCKLLNSENSDSDNIGETQIMALNDVYINKIGTFLPNAPVSNDEMEHILGMINNRPSKARLRVLKSNGIQYRYYAIDKETGEKTHSNIQITVEAIKKLENENFSLQDIDCLVCGTSTPDQLLPSHAAMVHGDLKIPSCEIASLTGVCISSIQALKYGYMSVMSNESHNVVCTGSDLVSSLIRGNQFIGEIQEKITELKKNPIVAFEKDFLRWMLSDGAGAVLLQNRPNHQALSLKIEWIDIHSFAGDMPTCMYRGAEKDTKGNLISFMDFMPEEWSTKSIMALKQDVKLLNKYVVSIIAQALGMTLKKRNLDLEGIDYFIPHFSSLFFRDKIYEAYRERGYHLPQSKWFSNLMTVGNVGAASIYLALDELFDSGKLQKGNRLLLMIPESGRFCMGYVLLTVV